MNSEKKKETWEDAEERYLYFISLRQSGEQHKNLKPISKTTSLQYVTMNTGKYLRE